MRKSWLGIAALAVGMASGCYDTVESHERDAARHEQRSMQYAAAGDAARAEMEHREAVQLRRAADDVVRTHEEGDARARRYGTPEGPASLSPITPSSDEPIYVAPPAP